MKTCIILAVIASFVSLTKAQTCGDGGNILIEGSTTVYPISLALRVPYVLRCASTSINVTRLGSSDGIRSVCGGKTPSADIGSSSRDFRATEATGDGSGVYQCVGTGRSVIQTPVAIDGITFIVGKTSKLWTECLSLLPNGLSSSEIRWLYSNLTTIPQPIFSDGNVNTRYWNEICGTKVPPQTPITIVAPGVQYGTTGYFTEILFLSRDGFLSTTIFRDDNSDALRDTVVNAPYGIGFLGYSYYRRNLATLNGIKVDGIEPTDDNLFRDRYLPFGRRIYNNFWDGALTRTACFGYFTFSAAGAIIVDATGFLPIPEEEYPIYRGRLGVCGATVAPTPAPTSLIPCSLFCFFKPSPCCSKFAKRRGTCNCV